jgi:hypothetical protein
MIQTATFPNLESIPNVSTQALLYFSAPMGTLTEVDVVTSGSFSTQFYAENLASSRSMITGTTSANISINVPTGAIPLSIPSVTENFAASAFAGALNYAGPSGKVFAPVTSSSASQTTVLTSPAALADFTGNFRIPISVSGHATGSANSSDGEMSGGFNTQTSVTVTIIYHYIPNLPSLDPSSSPSPQSSNTGPASTAPSGSTAPGTGTVGLVQTASTAAHHPAAHAKKKVVPHVAGSSHKRAHHPLGGHLLKKPGKNVKSQ